MPTTFGNNIFTYEYKRVVDSKYIFYYGLDNLGTYVTFDMDEGTLEFYNCYGVPIDTMLVSS